MDIGASVLLIARNAFEQKDAPVNMHADVYALPVLWVHLRPFQFEMPPAVYLAEQAESEFHRLRDSCLQFA